MGNTATTPQLDTKRARALSDGNTATGPQLDIYRAWALSDPPAGMVTTTHAALIASVTPWTIKQWCRNGQVKAIKQEPPPDIHIRQYRWLIERDSLPSAAPDEPDTQTYAHLPRPQLTIHKPIGFAPDPRAITMAQAIIDAIDRAPNLTDGEWLTTAQACELTGYKKATLWKLARSGTITARRSGRAAGPAWEYRKPDLLWHAAQPAGAGQLRRKDKRYNQFKPRPPAE